MTIRRQFDSDEHTCVSLRQYKEVFLNDIVGVVLRPRGLDDNHVCFELIHEDDGFWAARTGGASMYWMPSYIEVLEAAWKWCNKNCKRREDGFDFR